MNKRKVKIYLSMFDNSEETKGNPRAPKFRIVARDPETKEEFEGKMFVKKSQSGMIYLSGEILENEEQHIDGDYFNLTKLYTESSEDNKEAPKNDNTTPNSDCESSKKNNEPLDDNNKLSDDEDCPF